MNYGFIIGSMLARVVGPIANDLFTYNTPWGRNIARKKVEKERESKKLDFDDKVKLSNIDHQHKLESLQIQFEQNRKRAEEQMLLSYSEWQQKIFWEKCFPLRNPFEVPFGVKLEYQESGERLKGCSLQTLSLPNKKHIIPLRVILALKDSTHPHASTVNGDLSMFLAQYYSANNEHAVVSEIGAWKEEAPINDASINYLFRGQKGLPTLIIVPTYTNGGSIVRLKLWSWGLGEDLAYPIGFDFGWFNIDNIYRQILIEEIKSFDEALKKMNISRPTPYQIFEDSLRIVKMIERGESLTPSEKERMMSILQKTPPEVASIVQRRTNEVLTTIFSCATAMYADGFHLTQYGTLPILPYIFNQMPGAKLLASQVQQYYLSLLKISLHQGVISYEDAIELEIDMYNNFRRIVSSAVELKAITKQINNHMFEIDDRSLCDVKTINRLKNQIKLLS